MTEFFNNGNDYKPNEQQQECIDNLNGKYLVLAGPGTGKTTTLTNRIANMIAKGISPDKILCLTFTDTAVNEMKTKIEKTLNKIDCGIDIFTYHGFCYQIIEDNSEEFEISDNFKVISESVKRAFVKECIDTINPKAYRTERNDPYYYISEIQNRIQDIKKNRLSKEQYFKNLETNPDWIPALDSLYEQRKNKIDNKEKISDYFLGKIEAQEKKIAKAKELWEFYETYTDLMLKNHYLDFDDMINMVLDKFEQKPYFLEQIANKYEYIMVDEYQDTNKSQNEIVFMLTKALKTQNIFVVGDDDQIIFRFQGAKLDTIENFLNAFPDTKVICLTKNHRSTQEILNAARQITLLDDTRLEANQKFKQYNICKTLEAVNKNLPIKKVRCYKYADIMQEYVEIVNEIEAVVNSESCPKKNNGDKDFSQIAILSRRNTELETFAQMLKERNLPYELREGKSIFTIRSSMTLLYYMQFLINPYLNSDKLLKFLLSKPFNIHPHDYKLILDQQSKQTSLIESMQAIAPENFVQKDKIEKFINTYKELETFKTTETLKNIVLKICAKTGIFDYYVNSDTNRTENIAGLKKIIDEAEAFSQVQKSITLEDFVEYLQIAIDDEIEIKTEKAPIQRNAVQLSTYYSAKGREFEYVYMPTLNKNHWESDRNSFKSKIPIKEYQDEKQLAQEKLSDRIRVMYVGMTRAKHTLRLSYTEKENNKAQKPSELLLGIENLVEREPKPFTFDIDSYWETAAKSIIYRDYDYKKDFNEIIDSILENKSFSPTSLNTYLKCPRLYLYRELLGLESPYKDADALNFGTAVHDACEYAVKYALKNNKYPVKSEFIRQFMQKLEQLSISNRQNRENLKKRGELALDKYYTQLCNTPIKDLVQAEMSITKEIDGIRFKGKIDRVEKNEAGEYVIIDYKTGGAKDLKSICIGGNHEDYYNQMGFYKYLYTKETGNNVAKTVFIFPEDFTKNLEIAYTEEECQAIFDKYKSAVENIRCHEFEPPVKAQCNECNYCSYKEFCAFEIV